MEHTPVVVAPTAAPRTSRMLRLASDERLVALVRRGDERAFEAIYDRHHRPILSFCRHMLGVREEAEDALQHTFLAAYRHLSGGTQRIELRPWLFTIARNRCLSLLRARRQHVDIELVEPATDGLAAAVERREDVRALLGDLAELPEDQRAALLLSELGALDHDGIAAVLGCRREKVKALVFQARSSLAASRQARETPCEEIRLELATATGAALRRGPLRRHLRTCPGCRAFKDEVASQRSLMALALPVLPSAALKAGVLSHAFGGAAHSGATAAGIVATGAHAGAAAGLGAGATAGAGAGGGALATLASAGAAKIAISLTVAGAIAGGSVLTVAATHHRQPTVHRGSSPRGGTHAPAATSAPGAEPASGSGRSGAHHGATARPSGTKQHGRRSGWAPGDASRHLHGTAATGAHGLSIHGEQPAQHTTSGHAKRGSGRPSVTHQPPKARHRAKPHHEKPVHPPKATQSPPPAPSTTTARTTAGDDSDSAVGGSTHAASTD
jgi:RNA polymerase sigma factor (sigma-70 family)